MIGFICKHCNYRGTMDITKTVAAELLTMDRTPVCITFLSVKRMEFSIKHHPFRTVLSFYLFSACKVCKNLRILLQASRRWFIEYEYEIRT